MYLTESDISTCFSELKERHESPQNSNISDTRCLSYRGCFVNFENLDSLRGERRSLSGERVNNAATSKLRSLAAFSIHQNEVSELISLNESYVFYHTTFVQSEEVEATGQF
jgi:hypothetical protein